jgi:DNA-binding NarL/FixJ family response regulator
MPIRVLLADDHALVRRGLRLFLDLQADLAVVGEAADGRGAVEQTRSLQPDVVVMDVAMPGLGGIEATRLLSEDAPDTRVLVLSSFAGDDHVLPALRAGAAGYVTKDLQPEQLADAIRTVHEGGSCFHTEATREAVRRLSPDGRAKGTVTILFADIEASTAIVERLGDDQALGVFRDHDRILRSALAEHGGVEVDHAGDSFMFAFADARPAVAAAVAMQRALAARAAERPDWAVRVRMGINSGEVLASVDGYFGRAVFVAARIAGRAAGEQILLSATTRELASDADVAFAPYGEHELKGLRGCHRLYEALWRENAP